MLDVLTKLSIIRVNFLPGLRPAPPNFHYVPDLSLRPTATRVCGRAGRARMRPSRDRARMRPSRGRERVCGRAPSRVRARTVCGREPRSSAYAGCGRAAVERVCGRATVERVCGPAGRARMRPSHAAQPASSAYAAQPVERVCGPARRARMRPSRSTHQVPVVYGEGVTHRPLSIMVRVSLWDGYGFTFTHLVPVVYGEGVTHRGRGEPREPRETRGLGSLAW